MRTLTLAILQTAPVPQDLEATWQKFEQQATNARSLFPHVNLIVAPELLLTAPDRLLASDPDYEARSAAPIPSPLTERIGALARELDVWLVPGSLNEIGEDGLVYNTAIAVSPEGDIVARYRKLFPWAPYETSQPGSEFVAFDIEGIGRVGLAICYDGSFPEVARQLAWLGAEVMIQPTLTSTRDREMEIVMSRANAFANQIFVVNVNASDPVGVGNSVIADPDGTIMQIAGSGEEVLIGVLDLDRVTQARELGTLGLNRPWELLASHAGAIQFPMFGGARIHPPHWTPDGADSSSSPNESTIEPLRASG
ncbi:hydrolase [Arthrobacter sp. ERGS1:01]|uniref:carbon-nitrogen hydrolase family protein n=1 Tax=Arthrobacter sp. ERGS1:01 TaxID=1704044 RepID=UPI0006B4C62D|nr:carbon-nitrogen hydrolase family protein [Arthrobacter sp. ERGS1:01]ALE04874.1 hydrolase [Arthrobacter sp. ERGS1:01]